MNSATRLLDLSGGNGLMPRMVSKEECVGCKRMFTMALLVQLSSGVEICSDCLTTGVRRMASRFRSGERRSDKLIKST